MVGALLLKIATKKASMKKFPFTVHRLKRVHFILSGKAPFACTGRTSVLLDTVCSVHFTAERFTQALYGKGTRKYLKPGSVSAITKKNTSNHI